MSEQEIEKSFEELKAEATELGISFSANISAKSLAGRIEAHYAASENESKVKVNSDQEEDELEVVSKKSKAKTFSEYVQKMKQAAEKKRIVVIIDNDSRVNNQTTTCTVSAGNDYFDLGTVVLPLNERVEVRQGHLSVLKEIRIPQHITDNTTRTSKMVMRPRYSVQYSEED